MPVYEYRCNDCRRDFEVVEKLAEHEGHSKTVCPRCSGDNVERCFSSVAVETARKS